MPKQQPPESEPAGITGLAFKGPGGEIDPLVNEKNPVNPQELVNRIGELEVELTKYKNYLAEANEQKKTRDERIASLREQLTKDRNGTTSRQFRIYLSIVQGFAQRGSLDLNALKGDVKIINKTFAHAAGLAEVAEYEFKKKEAAAVKSATAE